MSHSAHTLPVDWNMLRAATDNDKAAIKKASALVDHTEKEFIRINQFFKAPHG